LLRLPPGSLCWCSGPKKASVNSFGPENRSASRCRRDGLQFDGRPGGVAALVDLFEERVGVEVLPTAKGRLKGVDIGLRLWPFARCAAGAERHDDSEVLAGAPQDARRVGPVDLFRQAAQLWRVSDVDWCQVAGHAVASDCGLLRAN